MTAEHWAVRILALTLTLGVCLVALPAQAGPDDEVDLVVDVRVTNTIDGWKEYAYDLDYQQNYQGDIFDWHAHLGNWTPGQIEVIPPENWAGSWDGGTYGCETNDNPVTWGNFWVGAWKIRVKFGYGDGTSEFTWTGPGHEPLGFQPGVLVPAAPQEPLLIYNVVTGNLMMDTAGASLSGFILHSPGGQFTGWASLPGGFLFADNSPTLITSQFPDPEFGSPLTGLWDFGDWAAQAYRWDIGDWQFSYTLDGQAGTYYGQIVTVGALAGDVDLDGDVDAWDIQAILSADSYYNGAGWSWHQGDFNGDTMVTWEDIQLILDHGQYGLGVEGPLMALIPEPSALGLLALGALAALRRRRAAR